MNDLTQPVYQPNVRANNTNTLLSNHFKFTIEALPDLTFFAQSIQVPPISASVIPRGNPFRVIKEVGDHLTYPNFDVTYKVDNAFKTYYSIYWWLCGYGFPRSYQELDEFRAARASRMANPRPVVRDLEKTNGVLHILQPDTNNILVTIFFGDIFPIALGELQFQSTDNDAVDTTCRVTFACNGFDVIIPE